MAQQDNDTGERTYEPTVLRLEEARREGVVPRSGDLVSAGVLLAGSALLGMGGASLLDDLTQMMREMLTWTDGPAPTAGLKGVLGTAALLMGGLVVVAVVVNLAQVGLLAAWQRAVPDLGRLSPQGGLRRIFSLRSAAATAMAGAKVAVVVAVACGLARAWAGRWAGASALGAAELASAAGGMVVALCLACGAGLAALAVVDLLYQRWQHRRDLRMTRRQWMDDLKRMAGDPALRGRRRRAGRSNVLACGAGQAAEVAQVDRV